MNTKLWRKEVERVADSLGLSEEDKLELVCWSIEMAYDDLAKAQRRFSKKPELRFYTPWSGDNPYNGKEAANTKVQCYYCGEETKIFAAWITVDKHGEQRFYHDPNCQKIDAEHWRFF